jgi:hypothetical protein
MSGMTRLIEIDDIGGCPPSLTLAPGDLLRFAATGGRMRSGAGVVEMLGPFVPGMLTDADGEILSPEGPPGTVMFLARRPGRARVEVISGDPFYATQTTTLEIIVAG